MNNSDLLKQLKIKQNQVLSKSKTYKCISKWKYDHFDIDDILILEKFEICNKPSFSDKKDSSGFEVSLRIEYKDSTITNRLSNTYFTISDWKYFETCIQSIE